MRPYLLAVALILSFSPQVKSQPNSYCGDGVADLLDGRCWTTMNEAEKKWLVHGILIGYAISTSNDDFFGGRRSNLSYGSSIFDNFSYFNTSAYPSQNIREIVTAVDKIYDDNQNVTIKLINAILLHSIENRPEISSNFPAAIKFFRTRNRLPMLVQFVGLTSNRTIIVRDSEGDIAISLSGVEITQSRQTSAARVIDAFAASEFYLLECKKDPSRIERRTFYLRYDLELFDTEGNPSAIIDLGKYPGLCLNGQRFGLNIWGSERRELTDRGTLNEWLVAAGLAHFKRSNERWNIHQMNRAEIFLRRPTDSQIRYASSAARQIETFMRGAR